VELLIASLQKVHLTAFIGYKAGMTHVLRDVSRPGSRLDKKEAVEAVTIIETPPMYVVGIVGYAQTPNGLRAVTTVWAEHLDEAVMRRFYKNWYRSKHKAFTKYTAANYAKEQKTADGKSKKVEEELSRIRSTCQVVRVIAHTQIRLLHLRQKKVRSFVRCRWCASVGCETRAWPSGMMQL